MARPIATYLKVLAPAAVIVAGMFTVEKLGASYAARAAQSNRDINLAERIFLDAAIWVGRFGVPAVTIIVPGALLLALWLAHAAPTPGQHAAHRLGMATACLRISTVLYLAISVALFLPEPFTFDELPHASIGKRLALAAFCLALAVIPEVAVQGIRRRRFWAWVLGLASLSLYLPSCLFPLGALGFWGLLDRGSRQEFGLLQSQEPSQASGSGDTDTAGDPRADA